MTEKQWAGNRPEPLVNFLLAQAKKNRRILEWFCVGMVRYFEPVLSEERFRLWTSFGLPHFNDLSNSQRNNLIDTIIVPSIAGTAVPLRAAHEQAETEWHRIGTRDVDRNGVLDVVREYLQSDYVYQKANGEAMIYYILRSYVRNPLPHLQDNLVDHFSNFVQFYNDLQNYEDVIQQVEQARSSCPPRSDSREERHERRDDTIAEMIGLLDGLHTPTGKSFHPIKFPQWLILIAKNLFYHYKKPIPFWDRWLTEDVVAVAQLIRAEQRFHEMPILGDTLIDAGCNDDSILGHCFQKTPHFDGDWLLERILHERSF